MTLKNKEIDSRLVAILLGITSTLSCASEYIAPPMVNIPQGKFMMGSNSGDASSKPMHEVSVESFQMGKYPVTVAEFRKFIEDTGFEIASDCKDKLDRNWLSSPRDIGTARWDKNRYLKSEYQPVNCMNYREAQAYADWIAGKTGVPYRLATEQEFEYAMKANTTSRYFWGDDLSMTQACEYGNFADQSGEYFPNEQFGASYVGFVGYANCDDGEPYLSIVGLYRPNPFGLYDMTGNISQIIGSCYYEGYAKRSIREMDLDQCEYISHRGTSWHFPPQPHADRGRFKKEGWSPGGLMGFRLAADGHRKQVHDSTIKFEMALAEAQAKRLSNRVDIPKAPQKVQLVAVEDSLYKLRWQPVNDPRVIGYEVYQSKSPYSYMLSGYYKEHYKKIKDVDSNVDTINLQLDADEASFLLVTKVKGLTSLPSETAIIRQEKQLKIPGRLDMQESTQLENVRLVYRKATKDKPELYYMSGFNHLLKQPTLSARFNVNVATSGWYTLHYKGTSSQNGVFFKVWQGNRLAGEVEFNEDVDDTSSNRHRVYLVAGESPLQITVMREGFDYWALGWITFTPLES